MAYLLNRGLSGTAQAQKKDAGLGRARGRHVPDILTITAPFMIMRSEVNLQVLFCPTQHGRLPFAESQINTFRETRGCSGLMLGKGHSPKLVLQAISRRACHSERASAQNTAEITKRSVLANHAALRGQCRVRAVQH